MITLYRRLQSHCTRGYNHTVPEATIKCKQLTTYRLFTLRSTVFFFWFLFLKKKTTTSNVQTHLFIHLWPSTRIFMKSGTKLRTKSFQADMSYVTVSLMTAILFTNEILPILPIFLGSFKWNLVYTISTYTISTYCKWTTVSFVKIVAVKAVLYFRVCMKVFPYFLHFL